MHEVGFEPTHLTILELKSSALDHSAIRASFPHRNFNKMAISQYIILIILNIIKCQFLLNIRIYVIITITK